MGTWTIPSPRWVVFVVVFAGIRWFILTCIYSPILKCIFKGGLFAGFRNAPQSSVLCLANSACLSLLHLSACPLNSKRSWVFAWDSHLYSDTRLGQLKCSILLLSVITFRVTWHPVSENHCFVHFVQVFGCFSWEVKSGPCYSSFARNRSNITSKIFLLPLVF